MPQSRSKEGEMNKIVIIATVIMTTLSYLLWHYYTPVEIIAVHDNDTILVKNLPYLKSQKIAWWEENKAMIQTKYAIPNKDDDGSYYIFIMDFGEGYRIDQGTDQDADLLCFDDMATPANCIKKQRLLWIGWSKNTGLFYR